MPADGPKEYTHISGGCITTPINAYGPSHLCMSLNFKSSFSITRLERIFASVAYPSPHAFDRRAHPTAILRIFSLSRISGGMVRWSEKGVLKSWQSVTPSRSIYREESRCLLCHSSESICERK